MGFNPNGAGDAHPVVERPSLYALVIYLPPPLGGFLDALRLEMVPGCNPHAHVSVLPPRPLPLAPEAAIAESRRIVAGFSPFDIELGQIEIFPETEVIYISVEGGTGQLRQMHARAEPGRFGFPGAVRVSSARHPGAGVAARPGGAAAGTGHAALAGIPGQPQFSARSAPFLCGMPTGACGSIWRYGPLRGRAGGLADRGYKIHLGVYAGARRSIL